MIWRHTWSDRCHCVALNLSCVIFWCIVHIAFSFHPYKIQIALWLHQTCKISKVWCSVGNLWISWVWLLVFLQRLICPMRHTFISPSMSRKKIADTWERNYQFRYSENLYTECCWLSRFGMFVHTSLKEATVHWQKPQHDTEQYCIYWKWMVMTLMVSSGFSSMVLQSTQRMNQWLALEQCFQDTSGHIVLRQFIPVMFWIIRNIIYPIHSNKRPPKTDLYKPYPPRNAYTASTLKLSLILLFYIFIDPGFFIKQIYGIL